MENPEDFDAVASDTVDCDAGGAAYDEFSGSGLTALAAHQRLVGELNDLACNFIVETKGRAGVFVQDEVNLIVSRSFGEIGPVDVQSGTPGCPFEPAPDSFLAPARDVFVG
jgi:hypothetical protein